MRCGDLTAEHALPHSTVRSLHVRFCVPPLPQGRYAQAQIKYQKALRVVERTMDLEGEEQFQRADALKASAASCVLQPLALQPSS